MPGLVKIGKSGRGPLERASQLTGTGHPEAFDLQFDVLVVGYHELETAVHGELDTSRYRGRGKGSEFFSCSLVSAVEAIRRVCASKILMENVSTALALKFEELARIQEERAELLRLREEVEELRRAGVAQSSDSVTKGELVRSQESRQSWIAEQCIIVEKIHASRQYKEATIQEIKDNKKAYCPNCHQIHHFVDANSGRVACRNCGLVFVMPSP